MPPSSASGKITLRARVGFWLLLAAALGVPVSLVWDFSWESTVGVDLFLSPPHQLIYASMLLGVAGVVALVSVNSRVLRVAPVGLNLGCLTLPVGAGLALWGTLAYGTSVLFDRWWQSAYGMEAGIWHPPQMLGAAGFFALLGGAWLTALGAQKESSTRALLFPLVGGLLLAMINVVTLTSSYPNRQHSASFYQLACATYPFVLTALACAGRTRWAATQATLAYLLVMGALVWVLPLVPAQTLTGPIYHPMTHLMPPPFPLLLVVPALLMDWSVKKLRWPSWVKIIWLGCGFFLLFLAVQWVFAGFLLSPRAEGWFFAGGGKHWPFFLKIPPGARVVFWREPLDLMNLRNALFALGLSLASVGAGWWTASWMKRLER